MRTTNRIIEKIVSFITNIDFKKISKRNSNKDKEDLIKYINQEYLNIDEYKHLLSTIKMSKEDILELIFQLFILIRDNKEVEYKDSFYNTKKLIIQAKELGFTWPNSISCFKKIEEEFIELKYAIKNKNTANIKEELGDLLFTLQCFAELKNYNLTDILSSSNNKFEKRFSKLKEIAEQENILLSKASSETKEQLWKKVKKKINLP